MIHMHYLFFYLVFLKLINGEETFVEVDLLARGLRSIVIDIQDLKVPVIVLT